MQLFQESGNAKNWLLKGESRLEVMMKMHKNASRRLSTCENPSEADLTRVFANVVLHAKRSLIPFESELPDLLDAVRKLAGSVDLATNLVHFRDFVRTLKTERVVRGEVWGALARVNIGEPNALPMFRVACAQACAGASDEYAKGSEQTLLTPGDVAALATRHRPHAIAADFMMHQAKAIMVEGGFCTAKSMEGITASLFYLLQVRLVHHVFRKEDRSRGVFQTMHDIGHAFCADLASAFGVAVNSPWTATPAVAAKNAPKSHAVASIEFDENGAVANLVDLLAQKGYVAGGYVLRGSDKIRFKVESIAGDRVQLRDDAECALTIRSSALLKGNFRPIKGATAIEYLTNWRDVAEPSQGIEWKFAVASSKILASLDAAHRTHAKCLDGVAIALRPPKDKGVYTTVEFDRGELVLVPLTTAIVMKGGRDSTAGLIDCQTKITDGRNAAEHREVQEGGAMGKEKRNPNRKPKLIRSTSRRRTSCRKTSRPIPRCRRRQLDIASPSGLRRSSFPSGTLLGPKIARQK